MTTETEPKNPQKTGTRVRWWPAGATLGFAVAGGAYSWITGESGEARFTDSATVVLVAIFVLLVWATLFSRIPRRVRIAIAGVFLALGVAAALLIEVRGFSGNLVPVLGWRMASSTLDELSALDRPRPVSRPGAGDYPQFLGPRRNATLRGPRLARDWRTRPPRELWRRRVGKGWSSFAVAGGLAVTQEQRGDDELVVAYALESGKVRWVHRDRERHETPRGGVGPRATPTMSGTLVYTMGATGRLNALDLSNGKAVWTRDVSTENQVESPRWGVSYSPLVIGNSVIVSTGGGAGRSLVAYNAQTGDLLWSAGEDRASYASPLLTNFDGVAQIVVFNRASVAGHDLESGQLLWSYPWPGGYPNVAQPLPIGEDRLLVSTGYGIGARLLRVSRDSGGYWDVKALWESPRLKAKFTNLVLHDGSVFGLDDGVLTCLDPATGERRWKKGRYGHGQILLVKDLLLVQAENGEVLLIEASSKEHRELARFSPLSDKTWNHPALAGRFLLVRNDREAAVYELPLGDARSFVRP